MKGFRQETTIVLLLFFCFLCTGIYFEIIAPQQWQPVASAHKTITPLHADLPRVAEPTGQRDTWFKDIVSRPLFSPDRKPIGPEARTIRGLPRLTGIIVDGARHVALFAAPQGGRPMVVEAGSHIGAYEVQDVADTGVIVLGPEGTTLVRPLFDPSSPTLRALAPARPEPARAAVR